MASGAGRRSDEQHLTSVDMASLRRRQNWPGVIASTLGDKKAECPLERTGAWRQGANSISFEPCEKLELIL